MGVVQNKKTVFEDDEVDIQPVINEKIVETVFDVFESVVKLNELQDCFEDLANRLIADLHANSFMEFNLELKEEQKEQLRKAIRTKGNETVRDYLAKVNADKRTKEVYGIVRNRITGIIDSVLAAIGKQINRGAIINAVAVQANAKNEDYDEILLRKTKSSGDITIPTYCILLSTNCVEVIKRSCQEEKEQKEKPGSDKKAARVLKQESIAADRPAKVGKRKLV